MTVFHISTQLRTWRHQIPKSQTRRVKKCHIVEIHKLWFL